MSGEKLVKMSLEDKGEVWGIYEGQCDRNGSAFGLGRWTFLGGGEHKGAVY